jgi:enamine deaminase RidA (YjgF/YER057c/UK114 family)
MTAAHGPDARLAAAGPDPAALGSRPTLLPLGRTVESGGLLITSGQVAVRAGALIARGQVGSDVDVATARECARQCARNVLDAVVGEIGSLARIAGVLRMHVYVASSVGFDEQHLVADAASDLVLEVLQERGAHARTALGVSGLPLGSPVEVDMMLSLERGSVH